MPLHGVGLIVGGTIAVIGSGYAFKKFVYDPHLAVYVEAFIAQHPILHSLSPSSPTAVNGHSQRPVPVPVASSSYGTSSARQPGLTKVRRRRSGGQSRDVEDMEVEMEDRRPLLASGEREDYYLDANELDEWGRSRRAEMGIPATSPAVRSSGKRSLSHTSLQPIPGVSHTLVDIDQEEPLGGAVSRSSSTSRDSELRSIIFDRDEASKGIMPTALSDSPSSHEPQHPTSLAASSSPADPFAAHPVPPTSAGRTSFLSSPTRGVSHPDFDSDDELDLISHPDTIHTDDYIDAESYTPNTGIASPIPAFPSSPQARHRAASPIASPPSGVVPPLGAEALGLSFVRLQSPLLGELASRDGRGLGLARGGSMSVISLSESEGGRSDDWEAI